MSRKSAQVCYTLLRDRRMHRLKHWSIIHKDEDVSRRPNVRVFYTIFAFLRQKSFYRLTNKKKWPSSSRNIHNIIHFFYHIYFFFLFLTWCYLMMIGDLSLQYFSLKYFTSRQPVKYISYLMKRRQINIWYTLRHIDVFNVFFI